MSADFVSKYGKELSREIRFQVSDGSFLGGLYDYQNGNLIGLQKVYKFYNMSMFESLVITYVGGDLFVANAFGTDCMPKIVSSKLLY